MTAQRSRKEEITYRKYHKDIRDSGRLDACVFCEIEEHDDQVIEKAKYFSVIKNIFPYSIWDNQKVRDHLMIIPNKHTDKLGTLPAAAGREFLSLIDKYEDMGYNLYARSPGSKIKSIPHQHSHLIKPFGKRRKLILFVHKPYIRINY